MRPLSARQAAERKPASTPDWEAPSIPIRIAGLGSAAADQAEISFEVFGQGFDIERCGADTEKTPHAVGEGEPDAADGERIAVRDGVHGGAPRQKLSRLIWSRRTGLSNGISDG
jgi:hypothetical protein